MEYLRENWKRTPFRCYSDTSRPLQVGAFAVKQQKWPRNRINEDRLLRNKTGALPSFTEDWKLIRAESLPTLAAFPQVCDFEPYVAHIHRRTAKLVPIVASMYGYWTGMYCIRFWRHVVPLEEQQDPEFVSHVVLIMVAFDALMTAMQIADDMIDRSLVRYNKPTWHVRATQTLAADMIQLQQLIIHVLQHTCQDHPLRLEMMDECSTFISCTGWIVSRDEEYPFRWNGERGPMLSLEGWYSVHKYRSAPEPMIGFILHLAGYAKPELHMRITHTAQHVLNVYSGHNDINDVFGDPIRRGEDIKNGSAGLPICVTLNYVRKGDLAKRDPKRAKELLEILEKNYGKEDEEAIKRVRDVFEECGTRELAIAELNVMMDEFAAMAQSAGGDYPVWMELEAYLHIECTTLVAYASALDDGWMDEMFAQQGIVPGVSTDEDVVACIRRMCGTIAAQ